MKGGSTKFIQFIPQHDSSEGLGRLDFLVGGLWEKNMQQIQHIRSNWRKTTTNSHEQWFFLVVWRPYFISTKNAARMEISNLKPNSFVQNSRRQKTKLSPVRPSTSTQGSFGATKRESSTCQEVRDFCFSFQVVVEEAPNLCSNHSFSPPNLEVIKHDPLTYQPFISPYGL